MNNIMDFLYGCWFKQLVFASFVTILLAICAYLIGFLVALFFTLGKIFKWCTVNFICSIFTNIFRCVPELLVIFFFFYIFSSFNRGLSSIFNLNINGLLVSFVAASVALGFIASSYLSEIFRGGLSNIENGQVEAAESLGMKKFTIILRIVFPQLIAYTWKPIANVWLLVLKDTALVAVIGISELMFVTNLGVASTDKPFLFYSFASVLYLVMMLISRIVFKSLSLRYKYLVRVKN